MRIKFLSILILTVCAILTLHAQAVVPDTATAGTTATTIVPQPQITWPKWLIQPDSLQGRIGLAASFSTTSVIVSVPLHIAPTFLVQPQIGFQYTSDFITTSSGTAGTNAQSATYPALDVILGVAFYNEIHVLPGLFLDIGPAASFELTPSQTGSTTYTYQTSVITGKLGLNLSTVYMLGNQIALQAVFGVAGIYQRTTQTLTIAQTNAPSQVTNTSDEKLAVQLQNISVGIVVFLN